MRDAVGATPLVRLTSWRKGARGSSSFLPLAFAFAFAFGFTITFGFAFVAACAAFAGALDYEVGGGKRVYL